MKPVRYSIALNLGSTGAVLAQSVRGLAIYVPE
jgi:hypothetical protein